MWALTPTSCVCVCTFVSLQLDIDGMMGTMITAMFFQVREGLPKLILNSKHILSCACVCMSFFACHSDEVWCASVVQISRCWQYFFGAWNHGQVLIDSRRILEVWSYVYVSRTWFFQNTFFQESLWHRLLAWQADHANVLHTMLRLTMTEVSQTQWKFDNMHCIS